MSDSVSSSTIQVGFELSQFLSGVSSLTDGYGKIALGIQVVADKSVILNREQEVLYITQKAIIQGNIDSTVTFKRHQVSVEELANGVKKITYAYAPYRVALSGITQAMKDQMQIGLQQVEIEKDHQSAIMEEVKRAAQQREALAKKVIADQMQIGLQQAVIEKEHQSAIMEEAKRVAQQREALAKKVGEVEILWAKEVAAEKKALLTQQINDARAAARQGQQEMKYSGQAAKAQEKIDNAPSAIGGLANQAFSMATGMAIFEVFAGIQNNIRSSVTEAHNLLQAVAEIRTVSQGNQQTTAEWRDEVVRLSNTYGHDLKDVAEGVYQTLSNQVASGANTEPFMRDAEDFAAVTKSTTTQAVNLLSSGIKGFGLQLEETRPLAASFFKLIELGRVRSEEMADTFGTTAPLAHQLGLSYNDLNATYAAMTIQGVKFANAATFTRNMMIALLKPSKDMKLQLDDWGVASGEAAIKTFGWVGLLEKLQGIVAHGGLKELASDFTNTRGLQGATLLSGPGAEEFKKDYKQFGGESAMSSYNAATDSTMNNPAKLWDIEWQKVKNSFLGFGTSVVETTVKIGSTFGSLTTIFKEGMALLVSFGIAWATYKVSMMASAAGMTVMEGGLFGLTTAFNNVKNAMIAAQAFALANPWIALATILAGVIAHIILTAETAEQKLQHIKEVTQKTLKDINDARNEATARERGPADEAFKSQFQTIYQKITDVRGAYKEALSDIHSHVMEINTDLKEGVTGFMHALSDRIAALKSDITSLKALILESESSIKNFKEKRDERDFEKQLSLVPDSDKALLEFKKAFEHQKTGNDVNQQSEQYLQSGNYSGAKDSIGKSNAELQEALKMIDNAETHLYKAAKEDLKDMKKGKASSTEIEVTKLKYQKEINEVLKEQKKIEEDILNNNLRLIETEKQQLAAKEAEQKRMKELQKDLKTEFVAAMKPQSKKQSDADKLAQLEAAQQSFNNATDANPDLLSFQGSLEINQKLAEKIDLLQREMGIKQQITQLDETRSAIAKDEAGLQKERSEAQNKENAYMGLMTKNITDAKVAWDAWQKGNNGYTNKEMDSVNAIFSRLSNKDTSNQEILELFPRLNSSIQDFAKHCETGTGAFTKMKESMNDAGLKITQIEAFRSVETQLDKKIEESKVKLNEMNNWYKLLLDKRTQDDKQSLDIMEKNFDNHIDNLIRSMGRVQALEQITPAIAPGLDNGGNNEPDFAPGDLVPDPAGLDAVKARSTAGEFGVNANAASQYRNEVVAMNANRGLKASGASGATQNNSFGNINISIAGGQSTAASVREIGLALRREIKLGKLPALDGA